MVTRHLDKPTLLFLIGCLVASPMVRAEKVHFTYLWHLEQPIYWPDQQATGVDRYERAAESIFRTDAGAAHPENNLRDIFGWADRVAVYQFRARDSIDAIRWAPQAGAQISYSGGLIENVQSLGDAGLLGYSSTWYNSLRQARSWTTIGGKPRCDIVVFPFHHPLLPLCADSTIRREIELYKSLYPNAWGAAPTASRGMFPPEMAFSQRFIPILEEMGIDWIFVSGEHISRACIDFPVVLGSGGVNCDPPNRADQLNPSQGNYYRLSISRGCGPAEAFPYAYTPHHAQYVDPVTGQISSIIVVPCAQGIGWEDGFAPIGLGHFDALQTQNDPARPMLVVLAHDGDNAWGGGFSYYMEATPNLVSAAQSAGYHATTVEQYLLDHPVPANDIVHVEDGAWVNADGDFGSPVFLNWNWPLVNAAGEIDIPNGWAEDERNWAVITAAQNRVDTSEQIAGGVNVNRILYPDATSTSAERAWHYFLGALNSGYMYFGTALDLEVKPTIGCNEAVQHADLVIGNGALDATPPTIWIPQRHPWNPGSLNFGPQYGYQTFNAETDFWIWTFVYDVSGVAGVTLKYRVDLDGVNPIADVENEVYADGAGVGPWQSIAMTARSFPAQNLYNDPNINFFETPTYVADQYYVQVTGLSDVLVDYYVEAVDLQNPANVARSPIQHVYVGDGSGSNPGGSTVAIDPEPAVAGQTVSIEYDSSTAALSGASQVFLHYGFDDWSSVVSPDPPMIWNAADAKWEATVQVSLSASQLDVAFNDGAGNWDNNGGADWHFNVSGGQPIPTWALDGLLDTNAFALASNGSLDLYAGILGDTLYVATQSAAGGNDRFILIADSPGAFVASPWSKSGTVAMPSAFVGNESDNNWSGWFDDTGAAATASAVGGFLEATIDLAAQFGATPTSIQLAVASYPTADGSALVSSIQVPPSINGDQNVDATEYLTVTTCTIRADAPAITGDIDGDCVVGPSDLDVLVQCLGGPGAALAAGCPMGANADIDADGDADLGDYAVLQNAIDTTP